MQFILKPVIRINQMGGSSQVLQPNLIEITNTTHKSQVNRKLHLCDDTVNTCLNWNFMGMYKPETFNTQSYICSQCYPRRQRGGRTKKPSDCTSYIIAVVLQLRKSFQVVPCYPKTASTPTPPQGAEEKIKICSRADSALVRMTCFGTRIEYFRKS